MKNFIFTHFHLHNISWWVSFWSPDPVIYIPSTTYWHIHWTSRLHDYGVVSLMQIGHKEVIHSIIRIMEFLGEAPSRHPTFRLRRDYFWIQIIQPIMKISIGSVHTSIPTIWWLWHPSPCSHFLSRGQVRWALLGFWGSWQIRDFWKNRVKARTRMPKGKLLKPYSKYSLT